MHYKLCINITIACLFSLYDKSGVMNALRPASLVTSCFLALISSLVAQTNPPTAQPVPGLVAATTTNPTDITVQPAILGAVPGTQGPLETVVVSVAPEVPTPTVTVGAPRQITVSIVLGDVSTRSSVPAPVSLLPVNIEPGSTLRLSSRVPVADIASIVWYKSAVVQSSTAATLELVNVSATDSGLYVAKVKTTAGETIECAAVTIRVETPRRQRLLNLSSRATISPANPTFIGGFVVDGSPGKLGETKTVLVRAVGPSLAKLGVTQPLADPKLQLFRADGTPVDLSGAVITKDSAMITLAQAAAGAFGLTIGVRDAVILVALPAGAYSAHVSSASGGSGDVLLEIYEIPENAFLPVL